MDNSEKKDFSATPNIPSMDSIYPTPKTDRIDPQSENQQDKKNHRKPLKEVFLVTIVLILLVLALTFIVRYLTDSYYNGSIATGPAIIDYQRYLEDKYGKSEKFYYVETNGYDCAIFNAGFCKRKFSTEALNGKTFEVKYQKSAQSDYTDQYWLIRYWPQLDAYYRELFDAAIPYDYSLEFRGTSDNQNVSNMSFEELMSNEDVAIDIEILTTHEKIPDIANINLELMEAKISDIAAMLESPKLNSVELVIDMKGSNLTGHCPNMTTIGGDSDGLVKKCSTTLYHSSVNNTLKYQNNH